METVTADGSTAAFAFGLSANMAGRDDDSLFWTVRARDVDVWRLARGATDDDRGILPSAANMKRSTSH